MLIVSTIDNLDGYLYIYKNNEFFKKVKNMNSIIVLVLIAVGLAITVFFIIKNQKAQNEEKELRRIEAIKTKRHVKNKNNTYNSGNPESTSVGSPVLDSAEELKENYKPVKQEEEHFNTEHLEESVQNLEHSSSHNSLSLLQQSLNSIDEYDQMPTINPNRITDEKPIVLIVDDSKSALFSAKRALEGEFQIITAEDGLDALDKMEATFPALVVTDIEMPKLDGFGLVQRMKSNIRFSDIPVIMVTANLKKNVKIGQDKGVQGFLTKPYKPEDLLGQANYILERE